jgi:putative ubiquitin-RnfH superfamily antitoxin RatB of RatAB toxin-antitoxin module
VLEEGARVEIYRPMTADPKTVPRRAKAGEEAKAEG